MSNDNYISSYSGSQVDNVLGLFHGKGLDQVTGLVQRNADGTFSQGSGGGGGSDIFIAEYNVATYAEILAAINANKRIIIKKTDGSSDDVLYYVNKYEIYNERIVLDAIGYNSYMQVDIFSNGQRNYVNSRFKMGTEIVKSIINYDDKSFYNIQTKIQYFDETMDMISFIKDPLYGFGLILSYSYSSTSSQEKIEITALLNSVSNTLPYRIKYTVIYNSNTGNVTWSRSSTQLQDKLVSGTSIKTFNNQSLLGSGNISETDPIFVASAAYGISASDITNWNSKSDFSGSFIDLTNKPTTLSGYGITDAQETLVSGTNIKTINNTSLLGSGNLSIPTGDENVQSDWNQTDTTADDYIKNKPTSMPASDVPAWAKAAIKPTYTATEVGAQEILVSGTNIKTINNTSLLGSGNINTTDHIFVITPEVTTYNELFAAMQAGKYLCIHSYDDSNNALQWIDRAEYHIHTNSIDLFTRFSNTLWKVTSSNTWVELWDLDILNETSSLSASNLTGAIPTAVTATTQSSGDNSTKIATTAYVDGAIANLPEPMVFEGSLGTGGTITTLPAAASTNKGFTYKVITAGTYASQVAKVGDTFISDGTAWVLIPSGDEPSGTVTSIATGSGLSGGTITSSGTISLATAFGDTINPYGSKTANYVLAAPNGSNGTPSFRALVAADLPNGNWLNGSATGSVRTSGSYGDYTGYTIGNYAVAEGYLTAASGSCSHAEGRSTIASGNNSHAGGLNTKANCKSQIAIGEFNIIDNTGTNTTRGDYVLIIGNGTGNNARSNALTVGWDGTIYSYNSDYERDTGGSTNGGIAFTDKNGSTIAYMKTYTESDGQDGYNEGFNIGTSRIVDNSTKWNTLRMTIDASGNSFVTIGQPKAWRKALNTPLIIADTFSKDNISITKGDIVTGQTINVAKSGYTPIAIVNNYLTNASSSGVLCSYCVTYSIKLSGTTVTAEIRNYGSSTAKVRQYVTVLYKENF